MTDQLWLRLSATPEAPAIARVFCAQIAQTLNAPESLVADLRLAVSEVVTSLTGDRDRIEIVAEPGPDRLTIRLPAMTTQARPIGPTEVLSGLESVNVSRAESGTELTISWSNR